MVAGARAAGGGGGAPPRRIQKCNRFGSGRQGRQACQQAEMSNTSLNEQQKGGETAGRVAVRQGGRRQGLGATENSGL